MTSEHQCSESADQVKVEVTGSTADTPVLPIPPVNPKQRTKELFDTVTRFKEHFDLVEQNFVERKQELEQIKYALLIREHVLLKGKPGTAKSMLGKYCFDFVIGSKTFAIQLSKFMSEEYIFGAIDINKMRAEGKVEHITAESIVDSEFAFIDEVFDGNDALLRSLLEVLNERTFTRHTQRIVAKLHTAIMTSNYVRDDEGTEAFLDRIVFKADVRPIIENKNRLKMYQYFTKEGYKAHSNLGRKLNGKAITYKELTDLSDFILGDELEIPEPVLNLYDLILREYSKQLNHYISDRKANKMLNILKASAVMNKRTKVEYADIESIKYALVTLNNDQEEENFRAVFAKLMNDHAKYDGVLAEIDNLSKEYAAVTKNLSTRMNPRSKDILDLNDKVQTFKYKLSQHLFAQEGSSGFKEVDVKFAAMVAGADDILRQIASVLNLSGK